MSTSHPQYKMVVFDMASFEGNIESRMCAFITAQIGDTLVGKDIAEAVEQDLQHEHWYDRFVEQEQDEHGNWRPAADWPGVSRGRSVAIFVKDFPPTEVLSEMVERAKQFCAQQKLQLRSYRLLEPHYDIKLVAQIAII